MPKRVITILIAITVGAGALASAGAVLGAAPIPVNVAEGKAATQSSTANNGIAWRAVDGNSHGTFGHASVTHTARDDQPWWEVDLGEVYDLTEIVLWNRTDCCGQRLRDVHVFVSETPFAATAIAATATAPGVWEAFLPGAQGESTSVPVGAPGRYVRVQLEGREYLSLAEVEVFSLVGQVGQPGDGILDVDVFVDGVPANDDPGPQLPPGDHLVTVAVVNQSEATDLWGTWVWMSGHGVLSCPTRALGPGERMLCEATVAFDPGLFSTRVEASAWDTPGARYDSTATVFAEVRADALDARVNLAVGKPARQSDRQPGHPAALAVDGNRDGDAANGSLAMTYRIVESFWEVDLREVADIDEIVIWNRTDCCSERLRDFHVLVSDVPMQLDDLGYTMAMPGIFDYHHLESAGRRTVIPVGRSGRYVRIQTEYRDAVLALAEVEVMGSASTPEEPDPSTAADVLVLSAGIDGDDADSAPGPQMSPGTGFSFTYRVTNTGTDTLWALYLWHDGIGGVTTCPTRRLDPGATVECVLAAEASAGQYAALVEATAWHGDGTAEVVRDAVNYLGADGAGSVSGPAVDLRVLVGGEDTVAPGPEVPAGDSIAYTYEITNVGTVRLWAPSIWHDRIGSVDCAVSGLAPGEATTCSAEAPADAGETAAGVYLAMWDDQGVKAADSQQVFYVGGTAVAGPALRIESTVAGEDADLPPGPIVILGDAVTWSFEVTNIGTEMLWGLWLRDPQFDSIRCPDRALDPGETVVCELDTVPGVGIHSGEVVAKAWTGDGTEVVDRDRHHVVVAPDGPGMEIEALIDGIDGWWERGPRIREGETATFSYMVSNTGSVPIESVSVSDDRFGEISCPSTTVSVGTTMTCIARERMELGLYSTYMRVTATAAGAQLTDEERLAWHVKPTGRNEQISLEVSVNGRDASEAPGVMVAAGSSVQLRYVLTNLGTWTSIYDIRIDDPRVPAGRMSCSATDEIYLGQVICTATVTAAEGAQSSLVIAEAWSGNSPRMQATDTYHFYGAP